jgi:mannitol/fructose-specific phosphotransferase system IIA component (Ntr-type)
MAKVIVKFLHGEERAGNILTINFNRPTFYLQTENINGKPETQLVSMDSVMEILFPKDEEDAMRIRTETIEQSVVAGASAFRLLVEFNDGEILNGTTFKYSPNDSGFYLIPLNPGDRNERIYINAKAVKKVDCRKLLGKILVDQKRINDEQLKTALKYQMEHREKKLGTVLKEAAIISEEQLNESLKRQKEKARLLGEILLEAGYITPDQLDNALHVQHENRKKRLGQILVELKYLSPNDICIALATQFHLPWIDLSQKMIPVEVATSLPADVVRKLEVIPVEITEDSVMIVASSQPQDPTIKDRINIYTPLKVELIIAYEVYIAKAIRYHFPLSNN